MTATISADDWIGHIRREYLASFIKDGGSSIKFAVTQDAASQDSLSHDLCASAARDGYLVARVSAQDTRIHMMDQLFFRIAEQVPWRELSRAVVNKLAVEGDFAPAVDGSESLIDRLASANRMEPTSIKQLLRPKVETRVAKNRKLARDFRVAVSHLCWAELSGGLDAEMTATVIIEWLTGRNRAVAAVKPYQIFTRIHRTNARHLFASLLRWVRFAGHSGLVIVTDMARVSLAANPKDGTIFYSKAAMFDAYEVLRQFIDATDEMKGLLMVLTPSIEFLDQDSDGRGLGAYEALKFRVFDEVRDQRLVNPMTSLVRVAATNGDS